MRRGKNKGKERRGEDEKKEVEKKVYKRRETMKITTPEVERKKRIISI